MARVASGPSLWHTHSSSLRQQYQHFFVAPADPDPLGSGASSDDRRSERRLTYSISGGTDAGRFNSDCFSRCPGRANRIYNFGQR